MPATISREEMQQEALSRAANGLTMSNWPAIFAGLMAKGIAEQDIRPRENVFTYHAWRALGRQVRRGEHGVKVCTFVTVRGKEERDGIATNDVDGTDKPKRGGYRRPWAATVFHVSQTDPVVS
jgi:antirestriction protein ArdC